MGRCLLGTARCQAGWILMVVSYAAHIFVPFSCLASASKPLSCSGPSAEPPEAREVTH